MLRSDSVMTVVMFSVVLVCVCLSMSTILVIVTKFQSEVWKSENGCIPLLGGDFTDLLSLMF